MVWLTQSAAGGVMPAVLFHAATNHYTRLFNESEDTALFSPALEESFDEIKFAIYVVFALAVIVVTQGRLGHRDATHRTQAA
jgi:hypothetical protein